MKARAYHILNSNEYATEKEISYHRSVLGLREIKGKTWLPKRILIRVLCGPEEKPMFAIASEILSQCEDVQCIDPDRSIGRIVEGNAVKVKRDAITIAKP